MTMPAAVYPAALFSSPQEHSTGEDVNASATQKSDVTLTNTYAGSGAVAINVTGAFASWPYYGVVQNLTTNEKLFWTRTTNDELTVAADGREYAGTTAGAGAVGHVIRFIETTVPGALINQILQELKATQTELGTDPAGSMTDVKTRLAVSLEDNGTLKANTVGASQITDGSVGTSELAASAATLAKLEARARPTYNLLINGGFDFAQRLTTPGTDTTIADAAYSADRWKILRENADLQYSRQDAFSESGILSRYFGRFTKITSAGKFCFYQIIEGRDMVALRGRTVTFQAKLKTSNAKNFRMGIFELQTAGTMDSVPSLFSSMASADSTDPTKGSNIAAVTVTIPTGAAGSITSGPGNSAATIGLTTSWQQFGVTGTVGATSKNLIVAIWSDADVTATHTVSVAEAGLYDGAELRDYLPALYADELVRVQRFCVAFGGANTIERIAFGTAISTTIVNACLIAPVPMRSQTPILSVSAASDFCVNDGVTLTACTAVAFSQDSFRGVFSCTFTVAAGLTQFRPYHVTANSTTNARLILSAEL